MFDNGTFSSKAHQRLRANLPRRGLVLTLHCLICSHRCERSDFSSIRLSLAEGDERSTDIEDPFVKFLGGQSKRVNQANVESPFGEFQEISDTTGCNFSAEAIDSLLE